MFVDFMIDRFGQAPDSPAMIWKGQHYTYGYFLSKRSELLVHPQVSNLAPGTVVGLDADFSPCSVAVMLCLIEKACIVVPLTKTVRAKKQEFISVAQVESLFTLDGQDRMSVEPTGIQQNHELYGILKERGHPGLVLFSSGSTGKSKGALHDFVPILEKYRTQKKAKRMITFLLFDHIGGINTMFHILANGGCIVTVEDRSPDRVLQAVEKHRVEVLPTSPTFINLLLLSEAYHQYDLSSLELISYGTEVMPESTLVRFNELFPHIKLLQTYGLSEIGIMHTKSKSSNSLWVKLGGEGFETRVVDSMLEIKAQSAMLGYLNAPSPFTEDGWFKTGDVVEQDGDYAKILGRKSEIINVGGEKVYPAEVESTILAMEGVEDAAVKGEPNPIVGQMVTVKVKITTGESVSAFRRRMRTHCKDKMPAYKIPQKVILTQDSFHQDRFKKIRL